MIVNKVDTKSDRGEKFSFKIIRGKKINGGMRTFCIVKSFDILEQGNLQIGKGRISFAISLLSLEELEEGFYDGIIERTTFGRKRLHNI